MTAATGKEALGHLGEPTGVRLHVIVADYNSAGRHERIRHAPEVRPRDG